MELLVVIVITGVMSVAVSQFIATSLISYRDLTRRTQLADTADGAARRMAREFSRALPNSIRVAGSGNNAEFVRIVDGGRYRADPGDNGGGNDHTAASDWLSFGGDTDFNILGRFQDLDYTPGTALASGHRMAIYSTGNSIYADAETNANPGIITPDGTNITITLDGDEDHINLSASHEFSLESPNRRLYLIDTPITYRCDTSAGTLTRYSSYALETTQPTDPSTTPLSAATSVLMTDSIESCAFTYSPGTSQRAALITIELVVASADERVRILHQVHVGNSP